MHCTIEDIAGIFVVAGLIAMFSLVAISGFWRCRLIRHIESTNYDWWKKLTAWPASELRVLLSSYDVTEDPVVNSYRSKYQKYLKWAMVGMFIFLLGLMVFLLKNGKGNKP